MLLNNSTIYYIPRIYNYARACCTENETCIPETFSFENKSLCDLVTVLAFFSFHGELFHQEHSWVFPTDLLLQIYV